MEEFPLKKKIKSLDSLIFHFSPSEKEGETVGSG